MLDPYTEELKERTAKSIESLEGSLSKLRTGRANPVILNGIMCDYYGDKMAILDLCSVSMPEPRQLLIKPYDRNDIKTISVAISGANIGIAPQVQADCIRLIFPPMSEDVRKETAKKAKALGEEAKVAIRNIRRDLLSMLKEDDSYSDDLRDRVEDEIQKEVDNAIKQVDELVAKKTKDILSI